jgi:hypothetical protein
MIDFLSCSCKINYFICFFPSNKKINRENKEKGNQIILVREKIQRKNKKRNQIILVREKKEKGNQIILFRRSSFTFLTK